MLRSAGWQAWAPGALVVPPCRPLVVLTALRRPTRLRAAGSIIVREAKSWVVGLYFFYIAQFGVVFLLICVYFIFNFLKSLFVISNILIIVFYGDIYRSLITFQ